MELDRRRGAAVSRVNMKRRDMRGHNHVAHAPRSVGRQAGRQAGTLATFVWYGAFERINTCAGRARSFGWSVGADPKIAQVEGDSRRLTCVRCRAVKEGRKEGWEEG